MYGVGIASQLVALLERHQGAKAKLNGSSIIIVFGVFLYVLVVVGVGITGS